METKMSVYEDSVARLVARDQEMLAAPYELFEQLQQDEAPLIWSESLGAWLATKHDIVLEIMKDPARFSNRSPTSPGDRASEMATAMAELAKDCLLYTSPSPRDATLSRMPSSA